VNCGLRWTWCDPAPGSIHRWNSRCYPGFAIFIRRVP
jgi:hypothetical protein